MLCVSAYTLSVLGGGGWPNLMEYTIYLVIHLFIMKIDMTTNTTDKNPCCFITQFNEQ